MNQTASSNLKLLAHIDFIALFFQILLLAIGVTFIYGAGAEVGGHLATLWKQQLVWIGVGFAVYFVCMFIDYHKLGDISWGIYAFSLLLLIYVVLFGTEINNARSWISIGGITIQPSEFAKPATLLFVCWAVTHRAWRKSIVPPWVIVLLIILVPLGLVLLQPDHGTALVFLPFALLISFVKGLRWRTIGIGAFLIILAIPLLFSSLAPHQKARLKVFLQPHADSVLLAIAPIISEERIQFINQKKDQFFAEDEYQKDGKRTIQKPRDDWNARQSLLAVGSGGMTGKGFLKGTQHVLGYLPKSVAPTDFIFSVIAEETGFFGSALLLCAFISIILCACRTALLATEPFGLCIALGVAAIYTTHVFINIGMTVQAAPIIGIPLPFVSYGGSFMISIMALAGLCQNVHIRHHLKPEDSTLTTP